MSGRVRHWKQRFDKDADFVFLRHLRTGLDPDNPFSNPGDPVPKDDRIKGHRLKRWWEARIIGLANFVPPPSKAQVTAEALAAAASEPAPVEPEPQADPVTEAPETEPVQPTSEPAPEGKMKHTGGGWYNVLLPGKDPIRVRGKAKAEALLE